MNTNIESNIETVDDKSKLMALLDENGKISDISLSTSSESDDSTTDSDSSNDSDKDTLKRSRKQKTKQSRKKKKKYEKTSKNKSKSKHHDRYNSKKIAKSIIAMNASLSDLSKSCVKLQQNIDQMEMFSGSHIKYTIDSLPTFPDSTSCIKFQSKDAVVCAPLKTVDEVKIFENMMPDSVVFDQAVSFFCILICHTFVF